MYCSDGMEKESDGNCGKTFAFWDDSSVKKWLKRLEKFFWFAFLFSFLEFLRPKQASTIRWKMIIFLNIFSLLLILVPTYHNLNEGTFYLAWYLTHWGDWRGTQDQDKVIIVLNICLNGHYRFLFSFFMQVIVITNHHIFFSQ